MRIRHPAARKLAAQKISRGEIDAILRRLQVLDNWSKRFGCRMGLVGDNGLKVWRYIANSFQAKGWAAFPSYRHIASKVNIARSTVGAALRRLKHVGALKWTQRPGRVNGRRVQGTNLFTLHMPAKIQQPDVAKVVAKAVGSVGKSSELPCVFSASDIRPHGATTDIQSDRLRAALNRLQAGIGRNAERQGAKG